MAMPPRYPGNPTRLVLVELTFWLLVAVSIGILAASWH